MPHTVQYPFPVKKINTKHAGNIAYTDTGTGSQTILFIHGLSTYSMCWVQNILELQKNYRCIAIDLPGNGLSDRGDFAYSMHFFAAVLEEFITQLKLTNLTLAGHSMGAQIAITLLAHRPDLAEKLVLSAPAGFETFSSMEASLYESTLKMADFFSTDETSLRKSIKGSFYHFPKGADKMIDDLIKIMHQHPEKEYKTMVTSCIRGMLNEPVFDKLPQIKQPALVVFGERDALVPNRMLHPVTTKQIAEKGTKKLPHGTLEMLPQCGHFVHWEKAAGFNKLVERFVEIQG